MPLNPASHRILRQHAAASTTPTPTRRDPPRPLRVGPYRPHAVLGTGGMATVYLATGGAQLGNRRWCALKVLHGKLSDSENYVSMFFNEAQIASEISHPHVCSVFDYGCVNGQAYLAMDYLRGKSLAAISRACAPGDDPERHALRVARVLADACEGLAAIHEHRSPAEGDLRVVHRDISPDNLILGFDGFVKVIDFGLAKVGCRGEKTQSGILKGKISYIAPELLTGAAATPSADIWSLGIVAWELLTGQRLFRKATDAETLHALTEQLVLPPSAVLPGLPEALDAVVLRALERDPAARYASAAEFGAQLWEFLRARPEFVAHRELGTWLDELFPGEQDQIRQRLESVPHASPLSEPAAAKRSVHLLQHLRSRVGHALPARRPSRAVAAMLVAAVCFAWVAFRWGSARGHFVPVALGATNASFVPPSLARDSNAAQHSTTLNSDSNFVVEVERSDHASEVIVRVRATPPDSRSAAR
jgi:serine/threonine protein kinase